MERIPDGHDPLQLQGVVMMVGMMKMQKMRKTGIRHTKNYCCCFKNLMTKSLTKLV